MKKTFKELLIGQSNGKLTNESDEHEIAEYLLYYVESVCSTYVEHCEDDMFVWFDKIYIFTQGDINRYFKCRVGDPMGDDYNYHIEYVLQVYTSAVEVYPHINTMERCDYLDHPQL